MIETSRFVVFCLLRVEKWKEMCKIFCSCITCVPIHFFPFVSIFVTYSVSCSLLL